MSLRVVLCLFVGVPYRDMSFVECMELFRAVFTHELDVLVVGVQEANPTLADAVACASCGHCADSALRWSDRMLLGTVIWSLSFLDAFGDVVL